MTNLSRYPAMGILATALALLACYGTLAFVSALSIVGITVEIENGIWAGVIVSLFGLAVCLIALRSNPAYGAVVLALLGFGLILWAMFASYSWTTELLAFGALIAAALWNGSERRIQVT